MRELIAYLHDSGTDVVFGVMGDGNMSLLSELERDGRFRYVAARHESMAVAMADSYARVTGEVGVSTVTQGPGFTNALTALVTAKRASTPLLLFSGYVGSGASVNPQQLDQPAILDAVGIPHVNLDYVEPMATLAHAFDLARHGQTPVVVLMEQSHGDKAQRVNSTVGFGETEQVSHHFGQDEIVRAVERLSAASAPVILAGRGALSSGAAQELRTLADRTGAWLTTTLVAHGMFDGHERNAGLCGGFANETCREILQAADLLVVFGASMNVFTIAGGRLFKESVDVIRVDKSPGSSALRVDQLILGDCLDVASEMNLRIPANDVRPVALSTDVPAAAGSICTAQGTVNPLALARKLNECLPEERVLVSDGGQTCGAAVQGMEVRADRGFVFPTDFGSIGLGLAAAIGAAIGRPDRTSVLFVGDGALLMNLGDLETACRERLPLVIVVMDDAAYGVEHHIMSLQGLASGFSLFEHVDFAAIAMTLGAHAVSIRSDEDLDGIEQLAKNLDKPLLLDCKIDRSLRASWLEELFNYTKS